MEKITEPLEDIFHIAWFLIEIVETSADTRCRILSFYLEDKESGSRLEFIQWRRWATVLGLYESQKISVPRRKYNYLNRL